MIKLLLEFKFAIPLRSLRVDEVTELAREDLKPTAWRFMAWHPSGAPIAADVAIGPPPRMIGLSRDKVIGDLVAAILKFESVAPTDLLIVRIPEVLTDALWMRTQGQIQIAPIRTQAKQFTQELYPNKDFEDIVHQLAQEFKKPEKPGDDSTGASVYKSL